MAQSPSGASLGISRLANYHWPPPFLIIVSDQLVWSRSALETHHSTLSGGGVATLPPRIPGIHPRCVRRVAVLFHTGNSFNGNSDGCISAAIYWSRLLDESCNSLSGASRNEGSTAAPNRAQRREPNGFCEGTRRTPAAARGHSGQLATPTCGPLVTFDLSLSQTLS